jgi:hypothetical protein
MDYLLGLFHRFSGKIPVLSGSDIFIVHRSTGLKMVLFISRSYYFIPNFQVFTLFSGRKKVYGRES